MLPTVAELYRRGAPVLHPSSAFPLPSIEGYGIFAVVLVRRRWGIVFKVIRKEVRNVTDPIDWRKCFADQANKLHEIERVYFWRDDNETVPETR